MGKRGMLIAVGCLWSAMALCGRAGAEDAQEIVRQSFEYWRGKSSVAVVKMIIHRPRWERSMLIKAWTRGEADSLIRILKPAKDQGNGTLKKGREMWIYNPKINRTIKIPPSMMSQAWMGSDFSNDDLAKTDSILKDYRHELAGTETHKGKRVYLIRSLPLLEAPVVWGMQTLKVREDHIFLEEVFYDEDLQPVKRMTASEIQVLGGKPFPRRWRMQRSGAGDEYTLLIYQELAFDRPLPDRLFTLFSLKSGRR